MVCRPGLAHQRLTPGNCHDLLFDDVIWVQEAQKDHYDFVLKMQQRGVEVLDLHELLAETLADAEARSWVLDRRITANSVGLVVSRSVRPWLDEMPAKQLAEHLIGGIAIEDLPKSENSALLLEVLGGTSFLIPPIPNTLFQRDPSCWIYGGVSCNQMFWPARKPETLLQRAIYKFHPTFKGGDFKFWFGDSDEEFTGASIEGGDVMPIGKGIVLIGMGERTTHQAVGQVANALFKGEAATRVIACVMPKSRAAMHLDTVLAFAIAINARCFARSSTKSPVTASIRRAQASRSRYDPTMRHYSRPSQTPSGSTRCMSSKPAATRGRPSGNSGMTATTSSLSSPAS